MRWIVQYLSSILFIYIQALLLFFNIRIRSLKNSGIRTRDLKTTVYQTITVDCDTSAPEKMIRDFISYATLSKNLLGNNVCLQLLCGKMSEIVYTVEHARVPGVFTLARAHVWLRVSLNVCVCVQCTYYECVYVRVDARAHARTRSFQISREPLNPFLKCQDLFHS